MKVRIITDSTADMTAAVKERLTIVPLTVHFGEEEYVDGVTMTHQMFYEKLAGSEVMPSTSQATPAAFAKVFEEVTAAGESAVVITIASALSGTFQSAMIAAAEYGDNIYVVDSKTVTIGAGILAELALQLADSGMSAKEIAERLNEEKEKLCVVAMLDTLEYLKRGGRISKTVAFAGALLSIKPVISIVDGEIVILGKARGSKQGNQMLLSEIGKTGGVDFSKPVMTGYTGLSDELLQKFLQDSAALWEEGEKEIHSTIIGSVIGVHAGPGAFAAAFFKKQ